MTTNNLTNIEIDEVSILSKDVRPAVRRARIAIAKKEFPMNEPMSFATFEDACAHLAKMHGMSRSSAMSAAAREHPDLLAKYNAEGEQIAKRAADAARPQPVKKAVLAFEDRVDEIAKSRGVPRHTAMRAARQRFPDEFAAAYGKEA